MRDDREETRERDGEREEVMWDWGGRYEGWKGVMWGGEGYVG